MTTLEGRLDCGSPESALLSFCQIADVHPDEFRRRCLAFDLLGYYEADQPGYGAWEVVNRNVLTVDERSRQPAEVCWFHATRTLAGTDFATEGILPTSKIVGHLWGMLRRIDPDPPPEREWTRFREMVESGNCGHWSGLYEIKIKHSGPFAFLIREELFHFGETISVNYFRCPETVEDICICYQQTFGGALLPAFQRLTRPCIVKFVDQHPVQVMDTVALYLYHHLRSEPAFEVNTCFDGAGVPVTPRQILGVEWPDVSTVKHDI